MRKTNRGQTVSQIDNAVFVGTKGVCNDRKRENYKYRVVIWGQKEQKQEIGEEVQFLEKKKTKEMRERVSEREKERERERDVREGEKDSVRE